ncbi:MAG: hypothetical protein E6J90_28730 [Deltaproteobacteria bacterium]|nr:MAG: hypothetical protein E6J90_28730 [Deltaproteobacteria bacterium]
MKRDGDAARADRFAQDGSFARDPGDPVQGFDEVAELQVMPLDVDALSRSDVEAAQDLAGLESELEGDGSGEGGGGAASAGDEVIELTQRKTVAEADVDPRGRPHDAGDLYGAHTPVAADRAHPDDDRAFDDGQNWLEALAASAAENGSEPEHEIEIVDDEDVLSPPHASDTRDRPVADHGAGGPRGL